MVIESDTIFFSSFIFRKRSLKQQSGALNFPQKEIHEIWMKFTRDIDKKTVASEIKSLK